MFTRLTFLYGLALACALVMGTSRLRADALGEALGAPELTWSAGGAGTWQAGHFDSPQAQGIDWSPLPAGEEGWVETTVTGPGLLGCVWDRLSQAGDNLLIVDGLPAAQTDVEGTPHTLVELGQGSHTLRWLFRGQGVPGPGFLGSVQWLPGTSARLAAGMNFPPGVVVAQHAGTPGWRASTDDDFNKPWLYTEIAAKTASLSIRVKEPRRITFASSIDFAVNPHPVRYSVQFQFSFARAGDARFGTPVPALQDMIYGGTRDYTVLTGTGPRTLRMRLSLSELAVLDWVQAGVILHNWRVEAAYPPALVLSANPRRPWRLSSGTWAVVPNGYQESAEADSGALQCPLAEPEWIETTVTGPMRASLHVGDATMVTTRAELNGVDTPLTRGSAGAPWEWLQVAVPAGTYALRWRFEPAPGSASAVRVDGFSAFYEPGGSALGETIGYFTGAVHGTGQIRMTTGRTGEGVQAASKNIEGGLTLELPPGPDTVLTFWRQGAGLINVATPPGSFNTVEGSFYPFSGDWQQEEILVAGSNDRRQVGVTFSKTDIGNPSVDDFMMEDASVEFGEATDDPVPGATWAGFRAAAVRASRLSPDGSDAVFLTSGDAFLERTASGPAVIHTSSTVEPMLDGGAAVTLAAGTHHYVVVPEGQHTLRWSGKGTVDQVVTQGAIPLGEALGLPPEQVVTADPNLQSVVLEKDTSGERRTVVFPASTLEQPAWLEMLVTGPAQVRWQQRLPVNGTPRLMISGSAVTPDMTASEGFRQYSHVIPHGQHLLRWEWTGNSAVALDSIEISPLPAVTAANAFAAMGLVFTPAAGQEWGVQRLLAAGGYEVWLTPPSSLSEAWLETQVTGPADLTFTYAGSVIAGVAGVFSADFPGGLSLQDLRSRTFALPAGSHSLRWKVAAGARLGRFLVERPGTSGGIAGLAGQESWPWWGLPVKNGYPAIGNPAITATRVSGPCLLRYRPASAENGLAVQDITIPPTVVNAPAGQPSRWVWLPPGTNFVKWHTAGPIYFPLSLVSREATTPVALETLPGAEFTSPTFAPGSQWEGHHTEDGKTYFAPSENLAPGAETWWEADVSGSKLLEFTPVVMTAGATLSLSIDGNEVRRWQLGESPVFRWPLPNETHRLRFDFNRALGESPSVAAGYLSGLKLLPYPSLTASMGAVGLPWRASPEVPWFWNGSAAQPVDLPDAAAPWLETDISGPAALDFQWFNPIHTIEVNGRALVAAAVDPVNGPANPGRRINGTLMLPAGVSTVRWRGGAAVPPIALRPLAGAFAEGAGPPDAPYYLSRTVSPAWAPDASTGSPSSPSLRTTGTNALWLPVEGPGTVRFAWKSSRAQPPGAYCHLDGVRILSAATGDTAWRESSVSVPAGWHRVQWVVLPSATAWVDDIRWEPEGAFAAWAAVQFARWTDRSPDLDPDRDGLPNIMEFALGTPPLAPDFWKPTIVSLPKTTGARITFPRSAVPAEQATLTVEVSADLKSWMDADPALLTLAESTQELRLLPPWRFARLKVTAP